VAYIIVPPHRNATRGILSPSLSLDLSLLITQRVSCFGWLWKGWYNVCMGKGCQCIFIL